jgi:hypothetical protein
MVVVRKLERISEKADRFAVWGASGAPFQVADRACAQPGPLGQCFLRETSCYPVSAKQGRERCGGNVVHHALLARSSRAALHGSDECYPAYHGRLRLTHHTLRIGLECVGELREVLMAAHGHPIYCRQ